MHREKPDFTFFVDPVRNEPVYFDERTGRRVRLSDMGLVPPERRIETAFGLRKVEMGGTTYYVDQDGTHYRIGYENNRYGLYRTEAPQARLTPQIEAELQRFVSNRPTVIPRSPSITPQLESRPELDRPELPAIRFKIR